MSKVSIAGGSVISEHYRPLDSPNSLKASSVVIHWETEEPAYPKDLEEFILRPASPPGRTRHEKYYFEDGNVIFLVRALINLMQELDSTFSRSKILSTECTSRFSAAAQKYLPPCSPYRRARMELLKAITTMIPSNFQVRIRTTLIDSFRFTILSDSFSSSRLSSTDIFLSDLIFRKPTGRDVMAFLRVSDKYGFESRIAPAIRWIESNGSSIEKLTAGFLCDGARGLAASEFARMLLQGDVPSAGEGALLGVKGVLRLMDAQMPAQKYLKSNTVIVPHGPAFNRFSQFIESIIFEGR